MRDYRERLYVPLVWWLLAIPTILILGGTLYAGLPWPWPVIIFAGLTVVCAAPLIGLGQATSHIVHDIRAAKDCPWILAAAADPRAHARDAFKAKPRYHEVEGSGHALPQEEPAIVANFLTAFVEEDAHV